MPRENRYLLFLTGGVVMNLIRIQNLNVTLVKTPDESGNYNHPMRVTYGFGIGIRLVREGCRDSEIYRKGLRRGETEF